MPRQTEQAIRDAVRACLARCEQGGTPLGVMAEFMGELRAAGWQSEDVKVVETLVRKLLAGIMRADDEAEP